MTDEWFTPAEIAALRLPGMPSTKRNVNEMVRREEWQNRINMAGEPLARRRQGKGGGWEYHVTLLPAAAQLALARRFKAAAAPEPEPAARGRDEMWDWFQRQPEKKRQVAAAKAQVIRAAHALWKGGIPMNLAVAEAARNHGKSPRTVFNWLAEVAGVEEADWLPYLTPRHVGRTATVECDPRAWDWYKGHYLTRAQPTHADTYERLRIVAAAQGWTIPSARTLARRLECEVDPIVVTASREGIEKAKAKLPKLTRDASMFGPGEAVNGDGLKYDRIWVKWEDGEILNTSTSWYWQDVRTRRMLAWRLDKTENTDVFRMATYDLTAVCAPKHVFLDNTTVAANKLMTGNVKGRHRFHNKPEDGVGLLQMLGMDDIHFTNPDKETGNPGAKPIERAFGIGGLHHAVATHPSFINRGFSKATAIPVAELRAVIAHEVARHNAKTGRRTQECGGVLSFDQAWEQLVAEQPPRVLSESQRRLLLMSREIVRASKSGILTLKAGAVPRRGLKNSYFCEACLRIAGKQVAVHFDPANLHSDVHVYGLDGRYLFTAGVWEAAGYGDTEKGRAHGKFNQRQIKAIKKARDAEQRMDDLERARLYADATADPGAGVAAPAAAAVVVEGHFQRVPDPERDAARAAVGGAGEVIHLTVPAAPEPKTDNQWFTEAFRAGVEKKRAGLDE